MAELRLETEEERERRRERDAEGCGCLSANCEICCSEAAEAVHPVLYIPGSVAFVNVYSVNLAYGGPEEGGWHYTARVLVEVRAFPNEAAAKAKAEALRLGEYSNEDEPPLSSVISRGEWAVEVSDRPGPSHEPRMRPCYE
jgi:hypothetical protein